ncbi:MAG: hypothetical protein V9G98_07825 [Candidatus Competibacter sp.]
MEALRNKACDLLAQDQVQVVIGYEAGTSGARRPSFARSEADAARLMWDADCVGNLAGYLTRPEIKKMGKVAIVANAATLRALLQLTAEHQLAEGAVLALVVTEAGAVLELSNAQAVTEQVATLPSNLSPADREKLEQLMALSREERRAFWEQELQRCIKCYACRSSCPMCYCGSCTMDCNRPQWVPVASHELGNLEYHTVRAMHLAGRCVRMRRMRPRLSGRDPDPSADLLRGRERATAVRHSRRHQRHAELRAGQLPARRPRILHPLGSRHDQHIQTFRKRVGNLVRGLEHRRLADSGAD